MKFLGIKAPCILGLPYTERKNKTKGLPQQAEVAQGVPDRLRPRIFFMFGTTRVVVWSGLRTGRLYTRINPWYSFLDTELIPGHMVGKNPH